MTHRSWLGLLGLPVLVVLYACGAASPPPSGSAGGEVCPLLDAGPPPVCPTGCVWDGDTCRKHSGILMPDSLPVPLDSGLPPSAKSSP